MPRQPIEIRTPTEDNPLTPYEKKILKNREWRANNKQHIAKYRQTYYQDNKEQIKEYAKNFMREHYAKHPEIRKAHNEQQKQKKKQNNALTEDEIAKRNSIKETKKKIRKMVSEVAYNNGLIQSNMELEKQIKEHQEYINSFSNNSE